VDTFGIITTVAGNGIRGYSGDGGAATLAELSQPVSIYIDKYRNLFIADYSNGRIRKVDTAGIINTIAGTGLEAFSGDGGPATLAELNYPMGVIVDDIGNICIADGSNERIRRIDTSGIITTIAGSGTWGVGSGGYSGDGGPATLAKMFAPTGITLDKSGNIYVGDQGNDRIRKVDTSGIISTVGGGGTSGLGDGGQALAAELYKPDGVAIDSIGNIYVADWGHNRIRKIDTTRNTVRVFQVKAKSVITVNPNPATTQLTIQATNQTINQLTITNLLGQTVYTHEYNTEKVQIDVADIPKGMYLIRINGSEVRKFVKE
jgi:trimeric autotransporter adhesin